MRLRALVVLAVLVPSLAVGAVVATAADALVWKFNGVELSGSEAVSGVALSSSLTIPGLTTTCATVHLRMQIANSAGAGTGEVTKLKFNECTAGPSCTVESIESEKRPWPVHLSAVGGKPYVVIEGIRIGIVYGGALCALSGAPVVVTGTAGGLFENATSTLVFNGSSFKATGTSLSVGASPVEWDAIFPMEALGAHSGEALGIS